MSISRSQTHSVKNPINLHLKKKRRVAGQDYSAAEGSTINIYITLQLCSVLTKTLCCSLINTQLRCGQLVVGLSIVVVVQD